MAWFKRKKDNVIAFLKYIRMHAAMPALFAIIAEAILIGFHTIIEGHQFKEIDSEFIYSTGFWAAITYIVASMYEHFKYYGKFHSTLLYLNNLLNEVPIPFKKFGEQRITDSVKTIAVRLSTLSDGGELRVDLENKIRIITNLIENFPISPIKRFWATSFDKPSTLMEPKFSGFFESQRKKLKCIENCKDKRRIIILRLEEMEKEFNEDNVDKLINFIKWHNKNKFELRFLFNENNYFEDKVNSVIGRLTDRDNSLTDFAIIGDTDKNKDLWVFGELTTRKIVKDAEGRNNDTFVQLYRKEKDRIPDKLIVNEYVDLYTTLWDEWQHKTWFSLSANQTLSEIYRRKKIKELNGKSIAYYTIFFENKDKNFINFLNRLSKIQYMELKAVDLMSLCENDELENWKNDHYTQWYETNIKLVKEKGCSIDRIYVLNQSMNNPYEAEEEYNSIFKPQIDANINLYFVSIVELNDNDIPIHDFVFAKHTKKGFQLDEFCWSLDFFKSFPSKGFDQSQFESPERIKDYEKIFNAMQKKAIHINRKSEKEIIHYLCNLNWESKTK